MNRFIASLPMLTALALSPIALSAQNAEPAPAPAATPVLYAEASVPATFSSSSSSLDDSTSSAASAPAAPSAAAGSSAGQVVNKPDSIRPFSALGVGFKIGIGGIGFDAAVPLIQVLNIRGGAGFLSYNYNGAINNQNVNASLKLNNAEIMLDYFPFHGSFRLSAGTTVYNNTGVTGSSTIASGSKITIGNTSYTSSTASPINANLSAKFGGNAVPRVSFGWGNLVPRGHKHWSFDTELGVEFSGTPNVGWTYTGTGCTGSGTCATGSAISANDIATQNASLQSDFNGFKVFPIFSIGFGYKIGGSH